MKKNLKEIITKNQHITEASEATFTRLKESRKTCIIMPTGTGKTIVSGIVVGRLGLKTMYLCPNDYILAQTEDKYNSLGLRDISFMTYPEMVSRVKKNDLSPFKGIEFFVLDEFHRLGAEVWGNKSWKKIEESFPTSKILGLTATEIRYLDGARDMSLELFGRDIAYQLSISDCFSRGILKTPKYVIGGDLTLGLKELEDRADLLKSQAHKKKVKEMIKKLRGNWEKTKGISGIYKKYILDNLDVNLHKIIVFHERIDEVPEMKKTIINSLRGARYTGPINFYVANSGYGNSLKEIQLFNSENSEYGVNILLAVNMFNEGLHIDGCEIAIMYRRTMSKNVYLQQVGRVLSVGSENNPVILDLVQNISLSEGVIKSSGVTNRNSNHSARDFKKFDLPDGYEVVSSLLDYKKICESFDEDKQELLEKLETWYNLALSGDLTPFVV